MLLNCFPQLACKSVNFLIGQLLISVNTCFSSCEDYKQICIRSVTKETLKIYRITTVLITMNVLSNVYHSELSIDMI